MDTSLTRTETIRTFFQAGRHLQYGKNETIVRSDESPLGVYYIDSGWVRACSVCPDGEPNILYSLFPGDIFPLAWALDTSLERSSFVSNSPVILKRLSHKDFVAGLAKNPVLSSEIMKLCASYISRLSQANDGIHFRSARQRVTYRLLTLARYIGEKTNEGIFINAAITNEYIARSTNMTRETASREMSKLTKQGVIGAAHGRIIIYDTETLEHIALLNTHTLVPT